MWFDGWKKLYAHVREMPVYQAIKARARSLKDALRLVGRPGPWRGEPVPPARVSHAKSRLVRPHPAIPPGGLTESSRTAPFELSLLRFLPHLSVVIRHSWTSSCRRGSPRSLIPRCSSGGITRRRGSCSCARLAGVGPAVREVRPVALRGRTWCRRISPTNCGGCGIAYRRSPR